MRPSPSHLASTGGGYRPYFDYNAFLSISMAPAAEETSYVGTSALNLTSKDGILARLGWLLCPSCHRGATGS